MNEITQTVRVIEGGQIKDLCATVVQAIPTEISFEVAEDVLGRKAEFIAHVRSFFPSQADLNDPLKDWERFYKKAFGLTVDLSGVKIPAKKAGFDRLIVIVPGITLNQVYDVSAKHYPCWRYSDDLNTTIPKHDRDPNKIGAYAIWIRGDEEPDENLLNLSANDLAKKGTQTTTILEQKIFELKYFFETKKHLDKKNITLCAGSRDSDGHVPFSYWNDGKSRWSWCSTDSRYERLGGREVVS
jgi:hypothetical protein